MRFRRVVVICCAALLALAASAADEVAPSAAVQPDAAPSAEPFPTTSASTTAPEATPAPTGTAVPEATPAGEATPAPSATAVPEATGAATPAPTLTAVPEATTVAQTTPAPTPTAEATRAAQVTPVPTVMVPAASAAPLATAARTMTVAVAAQATPTPAPAPSPPSECATPVEIMPTGEPTPSVDGVCRVSAAVCSILGTDGDDVLTGRPFDDIICGFGGNDRIDGGDGDDVLFGGEGDDQLSGGPGDDCMIGGPGFDHADNTGGSGRPPTPAPDDSMTDLRGPNGEIPEWPETELADLVGTGPEAHNWVIADGVTFDTNGRCTGASHFYAVSPVAPVTRPGHSDAPPASAPSGDAVGAAPAGPAPIAMAAANQGAGALRLELRDGRLAVRRGVVRVRVSCSAVAPAELVMLAGSDRIAHKRFTCTPPTETVRVRLNDAGRKLMARDDRVQARLLVLAAGRTVARQVLLVSADS